MRNRIIMAAVVLVAVSLAVVAGGCIGRKQEQKTPQGPPQTAPDPTTPPAKIPQPSADTTEVGIYFIKSGNPFALEQVKRSVPKGDGRTESIVKAALEALIAGPTADEKSRGLNPSLPKSTRVLSVNVEKSMATVNFSKEIITKASAEVGVSSTGEALALDSVKRTVFGCTQLTTIKPLIEGKSSGQVDGRPIEDFWGHVGLPKLIERDKSDGTPLAPGSGTTGGAAVQTIGKPADGMAVKSVRWSTNPTRFRLVLDLENTDGTAATQCPVVKTSLSASSRVITIDVNGTRAVNDSRLKAGAPLMLGAAPAVSLTRVVDEARGDDQMVTLALALDVKKTYTYRLYSLTNPLRVVIDVFPK
ncbi:MAG: GerMN domain-containing protein [Firmicutes bacterium]|nr:GerMN domain-containing protein [Bacillota bacterium]